MKTAVEWLLEELTIASFDQQEIAINKAKEMEKEQIIEAWISAWKDSFLEPLEDKYYQLDAEQYYNQTFKKLLKF